MSKFSKVAAVVLMGAAVACSVDVSEADVDASETESSEDALGTLADARKKCQFKKGALPKETLENLPSAMPIDHIIIVAKENRSFDQMLGRLPGRKLVDGIPSSYSNPDKNGTAVRFVHESNTCVQDDPPHDVEATVAAYNDGKMDGFAKATQAKLGGSGQVALTYFDERELPFYTFLANTYSISDRYFSGMLGPTWPNRDILFAATSSDAVDGSKAIDVPTIFDALEKKGVSWGVYSDFKVALPSIGFGTSDNKHLHRLKDFYNDLDDGTLPAVAFFDTLEEHPPFDVQSGEATTKRIYDAVRGSRLWKSTALFITYDEAGGFADHVPPPEACAPDTAHPQLNRYGVRVPLYVVSPYAKKKYVSHHINSHTSILRFVEVVFGLPALTARDANSAALLDLFDFSKMNFAKAPKGPSAGKDACKK